MKILKSDILYTMQKLTCFLFFFVNFYYTDIYVFAELNKSDTDKSYIFRYEQRKERVEDALANLPYIIVGANAPLTIQVRKEEDFPSILHPAQRIALFIELPKEFKGALSMLCKPKKLKGSVVGAKGQLEILFNKTILYREKIGALADPYCFIPADVIEPATNILEIRNTGDLPVSFDKLELKKFCFPEFSDKSVFAPNAELPHSIKEIAKNGNIEFNSWIERPNAVSYSQIRLINYFFSGKYEAFDFEKFIRCDEFFDPCSGKPLETWFAALRMRALYAGNPIRLPCNIVSCAAEEYLHEHPIAYILVGNSDSVLTFQCTALYGHQGIEADLTLPVPWEGASKIQIADGVLPKQYSGCYPRVSDLKIEEDETTVKGGVYRRRIKLSSSFTLRLSKAERAEDKSWLEVPRLPAFSKPLFKKGLLTVAKTFEDAKKLRFETGGPLNPYSMNYEISETNATKGEIFGVKNIIPYNNKSRFVKISYPDGEVSLRDGVDFRYAGIPENYDEFCFWIYPRIEPKASSTTNNQRKQVTMRKITFQLYLDDVDGKRHFLSLDLDPDKWQRVVLPSKAVKLPRYGRICIVGNPELPEYKDGTEVSFELNSIFATADEHPEFFENGTRTKSNTTGLKLARMGLASETKDESKFILGGIPGGYFQYRHRFSEPVEIAGITELSGVKTLKYVYKKEAQLLEISGFFPLLKPFEVIDDYTPEEQMMFTPNRENTYALSKEARKNCNASELTTYEKGDLAILVIRANLK